MYINPQTNIRLLHNVPLDTSYEHSIFFVSKTAQSDYFIGLEKYNLNNYTYQRVQRGKARVGIKADSLYDCNYMMFQNSAYGNKWFYAFITSVEFINNECSEISFEIDVMQTWLFDHDTNYCFVEREHSITDTIGGNIIPETCDTGEYVYNSFAPINEVLSPLVILVMVSEYGENQGGDLYDGVFSGATVYAFKTDTAGVAGLKTFLAGFSDKPDAIISMYMAPAVAVAEYGDIPDNGKKLTRSGQATEGILNLSAVSTDDLLNGYKPKNKKLYTYPYNFLQISTAKSSNVYRYEFFSSLTPIFRFYVSIMPPMQVSLRPYNYKGNYNNTLKTDTMVLDDYPICSWNSDTFKAWLAQNSIPIASAFGTAAVTAGLGFISGAAPMVVGTTMFSQASSLLQQGYRAAIAADTTKGNVNSGNIDVATKSKNFYVGRCSVSYQYAKMIDDYFTRFGYATKELKKPNRSSRPHWNYVKTVGASLTGSVPADDMRKLCSIYDNGITFWKNGNEVADYSLDNTV